MRSTPIVVAAALLMSGCVGKLIVRTGDEAGLVIRLEVSTRSARPGETVTARASVTNVGRNAVRHAESCAGALHVAVLNPDGSEFDDGLPEPLCPGACCVSLDPGERLQGDASFDGRIHGWEPSGEGFRYAPAGDYTIVARFVATANGEPIAVERRAVFGWRGP
jgi:hypothetical protein